MKGFLCFCRKHVGWKSMLDVWSFLALNITLFSITSLTYWVDSQLPGLVEWQITTPCPGLRCCKAQCDWQKQQRKWLKYVRSFTCQVLTSPWSSAAVTWFFIIGFICRLQLLGGLILSVEVICVVCRDLFLNNPEGSTEPERWFYLTRGRWICIKNSDFDSLF